MGETPGLRLGGTGAAAPESFAFVQGTEVIQLETRGWLLPHVVNVWSVGFDEALYVWSDPGSRWWRRAAERPDALRVRIGNNVYKVSATKVKDSSERKRVAEAYQAKYAKAMVEIYGQVSPLEEFEFLYRLTPRH